MKRIVFLSLLLASAACGQKTGTAPTPPATYSLAGTYTASYASTDPNCAEQDTTLVVAQDPNGAWTLNPAAELSYTQLGEATLIDDTALRSTTYTWYQLAGCSTYQRFDWTLALDLSGRLGGTVERADSPQTCSDAKPMACKFTVTTVRD